MAKRYFIIAGVLAISLLIITFTRLLGGGDSHRRASPLLDRQDAPVSERSDHRRPENARYTQDHSADFSPMTDTQADHHQFEEMLAAFDLPGHVKEDILQAVKEGKKIEPAEQARDAQPVPELEQLAVARPAEPLPPRQEVLTASHHIQQEMRQDVLTAARPGSNDTEQSRILKSDALMHAGFSAMTAGDHQQAESAFQDVVQNYTDIDAAKAASLELAMLMAEQGRRGEALQTIDNAIQDHSDDQDYVLQARKLKQRILK
ncbi:MAG: tetratricopeptide repeat protein [Candidatus Omnitrophota bacterium]